MFLFNKKSVRSDVLWFRVYSLEAMHSVWDEIFNLTRYILSNDDFIVKNMSIWGMNICTAEYSPNCIL